ncbi:MAG TPA: hypothetical protein PLG99_11420 [Kaistiaceae bacterium]|nr:hypothetical protein [Kaistiaceae bacterium]
MMEDNIQGSCWGVATWTLVGMLCILMVVYLFGGFEPTAIAAN